MPDSGTDDKFQSISDLLSRIEALIKEQQKYERAIKWISLVATVVSTIIIAGLAAFTTYRLGEQTRVLQAATAAQNQIHDLSSEQENVRYGAERYLAETPYVDLVLRQATVFGDAEILEALETDAAIDQTFRSRFKETKESLIKEMASDTACFKGDWREDDKNKNITRYYSLRVVSPKHLLISRGGEDGGLYIQARKIDKNLWFAPDFSWSRSGPVRLVTNDDCSLIDSNWGWRYYKVAPGENSKASETTCQTPDCLLQTMRKAQSPH